ncbi:UvrD-helicase domain-containing protein [Ferrimicrobium sp.]|uniref:UvrD-helicase domain-containing protein n=1 Tax=Ferrimicrobium sp. TaxID=2926050 RepID=UPI0026267133|nr:UvrD-helicase domain-containing protein [Ferrimicrobium sp.]
MDQFEVNFERYRGKLSTEQQAAVQEFEEMQLAGHGGALRVQALAGSGKTAVAIALICSWYLCAAKSGKVESSRLLVPTFTRAAVGELNLRLGPLMSVRKQKRIIIGTFDSLLRKALRDVGLLNSGNLVNRRREVDLLNFRLGRRLVAIQGCDNPRRLLAHGIDAVATGQPVPEILDEVGFTKSWTELVSGLINDGYMPEDAIRDVLRQHIGTISDLLQQHPGWGVTDVLVDEDQDCSEGDLLLPIEVAKRGGGLILLGDENQAIMGFRGGLGDAAAFCSSKDLMVKTMRCTVNFRSTGALVKAQNSLRRQNRMSGPDAVVPEKAPEGFAPAVIVGPNETFLKESLSQLLLYLLQGEIGSPHKELTDFQRAMQGEVRKWRGGIQGTIAPRDVCVLVPTNPLGKDIETSLRERGINIRFERALANPYRDAIADLAIAWLSEYDRSHHDLATRMNQVLIVSDGLGKWCDPRDKAECISTSVKFRQVFLERFGGPRATDLDCVATAWECLEKIACGAPTSRGIENLSTLLSGLKSGGDTRERLESLAELLPSLRYTPVVRGKAPTVAGPHDSLPTAFRRLIEKNCVPNEVSNVLDQAAVSYDQREPAQQDDNVVVMRTIHRAKGLGFRVVIVVRSDLIGARGTRQTIGQLDQDACQAYVAASRATQEHYEIALERVNRFHRPELHDWRYFDNATPHYR